MTILRYPLALLAFACLLRVLTNIEKNPDWFDLAFDTTIGTLLLLAGILHLRAARHYDPYRRLELAVAIANALLALAFATWSIYALYTDILHAVLLITAVASIFAANAFVLFKHGPARVSRNP